MPYAEPSSFPPLFSDPTEWREAYVAYVQEYQQSRKTATATLELQINLKRLGYGGVLLQNEMHYIVTQCTL